MAAKQKLPSHLYSSDWGSYFSLFLFFLILKFASKRLLNYMSRNYVYISSANTLNNNKDCDSDG